MNIKLIFNLTLALLMFNATLTQTLSAQENSESVHNSKVLIDLNTLPAWFNKFVERAKIVKKKSKLKIEKFNVNSKIIGKAKLIEEINGTWYYQIDIGTESPVECFVLTEFDGPANSLYAIVENSLSNVEEINNKKMSGKSTYAVGSGVIAGNPYLLLDTLYILGEGDKRASGILKGLSARTDTSLQVCMHNELGYSKAFFSVFESFVDAFTKSENSETFFEIVTQLIYNDLPLGYYRERYAVDSEGDIQMTYESSKLIPFVGKLNSLPDDTSSLLRSDSGFTGWSKSDGALINKTEYSIQNSRLNSNLSIGIKNDKWRVEGQREGKDVQYDLEYEGWLLSDYGTYVALRNLAKSEQSSVTYSKWLPNGDPNLVFPTLISKINNKPNANFRLDMGPVILEFMADDDGVYSEGTLEQEALTLDFKRMFIKGQPTLN